MRIYYKNPFVATVGLFTVYFIFLEKDLYNKCSLIYISIYVNQYKTYIHIYLSVYIQNYDDITR